MHGKIMYGKHGTARKDKPQNKQKRQNFTEKNLCKSVKSVQSVGK